MFDTQKGAYATNLKKSSEIFFRHKAPISNCVTLTKSINIYLPLLALSFFYFLFYFLIGHKILYIQTYIFTDQKDYAIYKVKIPQ